RPPPPDRVAATSSAVKSCRERRRVAAELLCWSDRAAATTLPEHRRPTRPPSPPAPDPRRRRGHPAPALGGLPRARLLRRRHPRAGGGRGPPGPRSLRPRDPGPRPHALRTRGPGGPERDPLPQPVAPGDHPERQHLSRDRGSRGRAEGRRGAHEAAAARRAGDAGGRAARGPPMNTRCLLDQLLAPGSLRAEFQPVFQVSATRPPVHYLEGLLRGPAGSSVERPEVLFAYARRKRAEVAMDRASLITVLSAARALGDVSIGVNVHATTLAVDLQFLPFLWDVLMETGIEARRLVLEV